MVSRGARRIEIRGAGEGRTSVCAVGATLAVARWLDMGAGRRATFGRFALAVARWLDTGAGRRAIRESPLRGRGMRIAAAVGPSIARPLIRRLLRRGRHRRADPHIENSRPKDAGRLFCVLWCAGMRGNPFRQPPRGGSAAATSPDGGGKRGNPFRQPPRGGIGGCHLRLAVPEKRCAHSFACVFRPLRKFRLRF